MSIVITFTTVADVTAPVLTSTTPTSGAMGVPRDVQFQVQLDDTESGIDIATPEFTLSFPVSMAPSEPIFVGGVLQAGWSWVGPPGWAVTLGGLRAVATFTRDTLFDFETYCVITPSFYDYAGNWSEGWISNIYDFTIVPVDRPTLTYEFPAHQSGGVSNAPVMKYVITDLIGGPAPATLQIRYKVDDGVWEDAYINGEVQFGYNETDFYLLAEDLTVEFNRDAIFPDGVRVDYEITIEDVEGNSATFAHYFVTYQDAIVAPGEIVTDVELLPAPEGFNLEIYRFIIREIRRLDKTIGNLSLKRYLQGPQATWAHTLAKIVGIRDFADINKIPDEVLQFQKAILGWTSDPLMAGITDRLSEDGLRRLLSVSGAMWRGRGTEQTILDVLQVLTKSRAMIWDWFDLRWILGETGLGEEREGSDPWLVELPSEGDAPHWMTLRIADDGTLDRTLVRRVLRLMRPINENFEIIYLLFLDQFAVAGDNVQWSLGTSSLVVRDGSLVMDDAVSLEYTRVLNPDSDDWGDIILSAKIKGTTTSGDGFGIFFSGKDDGYEVLVDPTAQTVTLNRVTAGVPSTITSTNISSTDLISWDPDLYYTMRIVRLVLPSGNTQIAVSVDQINLIDFEDSGSVLEGTIGLIHKIGSTLDCAELEVAALPVDSDTLIINENP